MRYKIRLINTNEGLKATPGNYLWTRTTKKREAFTTSVLEVARNLAQTVVVDKFLDEYSVEIIGDDIRIGVNDELFICPVCHNWCKDEDKVPARYDKNIDICPQCRGDGS